MRVLYIVTQQDMGGAQKYVLDLAEHFSGSIGAGPEGRYLSTEAAHRNIPWYPLPHLRRALQPLADIRAMGELWRLIRRVKPDILHLNSSKAGILGSIIGKLHGLPVVFTAHGFQYLEPMSTSKKRFFRLCERVAKPFRNHIITVSDRDRLIALNDRVIDAHKSETIYHGITPPDFLDAHTARTTLGLPIDTLLIGCIANFYPTKGLDALLTAFAEVLARFPHARLVLIGDGPAQNQLTTQANQLGIAAQVIFIGHRAHAAQYLRAFHVFVLPSRKEGFPYVLLEALAAGLPIVATNVGGVAELVGPAAELVPPEKPEALATALVRLLEDKALRDTLSQKALNRFQQFSFNRMLQATQAVYARLLQP
jgi:glycosyltransferase involved in cell wall biosynthesis